LSFSSYISNKAAYDIDFVCCSPFYYIFRVFLPISIFRGLLLIMDGRKLKQITPEVIRILIPDVPKWVRFRVCDTWYEIQVSD